MSEPPLATSPKLETRKLKLKIISFLSPVGVERTFALYEGDTIQYNDYSMKLTMLARPEAPNLQRPLGEEVVIYRVNIFLFNTLESVVDVEIDPTKLPPTLTL